MPEDISRVREALCQASYPPAACARLVAECSSDSADIAPILALKKSLQQSGLRWDGDTFERALLASAAEATAPGIDGLPVHPGVKRLLRDEFAFYTEPSANAANALEPGKYLFTTGCRVISLRRFPCGPMDWVVSGLPRSWIVKAPPLEIPRFLWFVVRRMGGVAPLFYMHVARRPKNRGLLLEKEVLASYYRMARSLEYQPDIKGILGSSWFFDPAALRDNPHLAWVNRPYLETKSLIMPLFPADADAGFLEYNAARKKQFAEGTLRYRIAAAIWPRQSALDWAAQHPELDR